MHDHLKDSPSAAAMSDDELVAEFYDLGTQNKLSDLQQAIADEMRLRHTCEAVSACWPVQRNEEPSRNDREEKCGNRRMVEQT
jgi:hypothetical protein